MDEIADYRPINERHYQHGGPVEEDVAQTRGFVHRPVLHTPNTRSSGIRLLRLLFTSHI